MLCSGVLMAVAPIWLWLGTVDVASPIGLWLLLLYGCGWGTVAVASPIGLWLWLLYGCGWGTVAVAPMAVAVALVVSSSLCCNKGSGISLTLPVIGPLIYLRPRGRSF